ncbi:ATP-dependent DNA ligase [Candidatus Gottesmanbacteria bacterium]|nr:ATP-dependent DNA ligase [Candidatus Gottesmanbacteria bacterium]
MTFSDLSIYFKKLEETASRNTMTQILAELFKKSAPEEIGKICYLLQGRVVPLYEAVEFGVADKLVIRAIAKACDVQVEQVVRAFKRTGDLGTVAEEIKNLKSKIKNTNQNLKIEYMYQQLFTLAKEAGSGSQEKKITILAELISLVDATSARYVARIPLDKLRLGFSDMTILDALSWMLIGDKSLRDALEGSYNVRPDIGLLAQTIKEDGIEGLAKVKASVGAPILASLCQRLPSADEMIKKMGKVAVEPKYDGVRVQIHFQNSEPNDQNSRVKTFSRNLENTTEMFPELQNIGKQLNASEVILDSEAVGMDPKTGKLIPFQETMTRKRKHDIVAKSLNVPLKFFVFDILYRDGKELLNIPLSDRRKELERTVKKGPLLVISPQIVTDSAEIIRRFHDEQIKVGLEGAVVKKWNSPYEPGRRGYSWVKFKEEEGKTGKLTDTIDGVVMGYYRGEGKRAGFGIGAFLVGVRRGEAFVTVTKIGTGVSDELWRDLRGQLNKLKVAKQPKEYVDVNKIFLPDVWVTPKLVVEIAGDDLTKSPTHGAAIAVRFPRLVRIRTDKSPEQTTTVAEVKKMYEQQ